MAADGRTQLGHAERGAIAPHLGRLVRKDPAPAVRELALYTIGNLGLPELAELLGKQLGDPDWRIRRAAATALAEFPATSQVALLTERLVVEDVEDVQFRILRAVLRAIAPGSAPDAALARLAADRMPAASPRCWVLLLALLGRSRDTANRPALECAAAEPALAAAEPAIVALGEIADPGSLPVALALTLASDTALQRRAAWAPGRIGGPTAQARLAELASDGERETAVRSAAITALEATDLDPELAAALRPCGLEDVLPPALLDLRLRAIEGRAARRAPGVLDIDRRLARAIPGFDSELLAARHPEAIQAIRTAEYYQASQESLPAGLDGGAPVIFWVSAAGSRGFASVREPPRPGGSPPAPAPPAPPSARRGRRAGPAPRRWGAGRRPG